MDPLYSSVIETPDGPKEIAVFHEDLTEMDQTMDLLTISCFGGSYQPVNRTVIRALQDSFGISVEDLAERPEIDLRKIGNVWLSRELPENVPFRRIGTVEMIQSPQNIGHAENEQNSILGSVRTYFQMLKLAAGCGIPMGTVALPLLGAGRQRIDAEFITTPLLNECINFLKECPSARRVCFVEKSAPKAYLIARTLEQSYRLHAEQHIPNAGNKSFSAPGISEMPVGIPKEFACCPYTFLSYSSRDYETMLALSRILEERGIKIWYAPRDIFGSDYASAIVSAISHASDAIVLISRNSLTSRHVLNEIDLAFNRLPSEKLLIPVFLGDMPLPDALSYYLSRLHWFKAPENSPDAAFRRFADSYLVQSDGND